jgi:glycosyltransferase involved in cell wall biosynthesis
MKVLFLIHRYPPAQGGAEQYVQEMAHRLVQEGHQVTVYTSNVLDVEAFWGRGRRIQPGTEDDAGVQVHRFAARVLPLHGAVSRLARVLGPTAGLVLGPPGLMLPGLWRAVRRGGPFDIVHASAYPAMMALAAVASRRLSARLVLMPCAHPGLNPSDGQYHYFLGRPMLRLYAQSQAVVALTGLEKQMLVQAGIAAEKVWVTGAGAVWDEAGQGADGARFRQAYGLPPQAPIVAFVGHKTLGKGALALLDACQALLDRHPAVVLALSGASTPEFERHYAALPPQRRAHVLDLHLNEGEKHDLLAASAALALPSRDDSFGIVLLEAWLHGKPVVGARAGGIPAVIQEGETGLLVPYGDPATLAETLGWLLEHPAEAAVMGSRGRERTQRCWTWDAVYQRLRPAYEGCRLL